MWIFADTPHLMKLLRNHIIDDGVCLQDGTTITKETIKTIMDADNGEDYKLLPKLGYSTHLHVNI